MDEKARNRAGDALETGVMGRGLSPEPDELFDIGVVGGVGPAATVDFLSKIIHHTPAINDQDHLKMIVVHNPKIPGFSANLVGDGPDPTLALSAVCKRLEANGVSMIAIPCNTAHAFIDSIQPQLSVPIINILFETMQHIECHYGDTRRIGLLATEGTLKSRLYHDLIKHSDRSIVVPDDVHQRILMNVIFGDKGVKAGYTDGVCLAEFSQVLEHVIDAGAELVILGCTELPLVSAGICAGSENEKLIRMLDPTDILARRCVEISTGIKISTAV